MSDEKITINDFNLDEIEIERMEENDLLQVIKIERESFRAPWSLSLFYGELKNPLSRYYVARLGRTVLGYVGILVILDEGQITTIAVHPEARSRGVGRALLKYILVQGSLWKLDHVTLEVRESNTEAQRLYSDFGFKVVGKRKGYYSETGEDALLMDSPKLQDDNYKKALGVPEEAQSSE